jgi:hypothetical protein
MTIAYNLNSIQLDSNSIKEKRDAKTGAQGIENMLITFII